MRQSTTAGSDPALTVRGYAVTHPPGTVVLPTADGWDQLLYASSGVMRAVGYATPSAFGVMFRRQLGEPPIATSPARPSCPRQPAADAASCRDD